LHVSECFGCKKSIDNLERSISILKYIYLNFIFKLVVATDPLSFWRRNAREERQEKDIAQVSYALASTVTKRA